MSVTPPSNPNKFFGLKVSKPGLPVASASDKQLVYKDDFSTKTYYDNTNIRMIEGLLPDGSYGMIASKAGSDATTASPAQVAFSTSLGSFIVGYSTTDTVVVGPGDGVSVPQIVSKNYTHNLGLLGLVFITGFDAVPPGAALLLSQINAFTNSQRVSATLNDANSFGVSYVGDISASVSSTFTVTINYMVLTH